MSVFPFFYVLFCLFVCLFFQHIVVEVELGEKTTERFKSSSVEFIKYAMENVSLRNIPFSSLVALFGLL